MKAKTIRKVLKAKIDDWLESIEDEKVRALAKNSVIVTGGCIASMLLGEKVNDFDIYFRSKTVAEAVAQYYIDRFKVKNKKGIPCKISLQSSEDRIRVVIKSAGIASEDGSDKPYEYFEASEEDAAGAYVSDIMTDPGNIQDVYEDTQATAEETTGGYRPVFMSTNAITLSDRIQIVIRFFGEPDQIHENYDFVHCTNYWTSWDDELVLRPKALESLLSKELIYIGSRYPICSVIRLRKFIARQWTVNAGQILKMCLQISELDLKNYEVLQDQLTGVDAAYFSEVLAKVKQHDSEKLNSAYLIEIIDRMF